MFLNRLDFQGNLVISCTLTYKDLGNSWGPIFVHLIIRVPEAEHLRLGKS